MADPRDPFKHARANEGLTLVEAEGQDVPLLLRLKDVKQTCLDIETFSNDNPLMIVLHSEEHVRDVRQLPIETDPPDHSDYRALVEPTYNKGKDPEYVAGIRSLVAAMLSEALPKDEVEVVREFALPLQSVSLARMLGLPDSEAEQWIGWGIHVFHDNALGPKGSEVDKYILAKFESTKDSDGDDFFSTLNRIEFRGRKLTLKEKHGFANMAFAGGRDTIIHTVSSIIAHLAEHPEALSYLRENQDQVFRAGEEYVRFVSPLTVISRTCPAATSVDGHLLRPGERIGLCWPSANRDETVFESPDKVVLDRKPNPHVGFGYGAHLCLGQHQTRAILHGLLQELSQRLERIELLEAVPEVEQESSYSRQVGYKSLRVRFHARGQEA